MDVISFFIGVFLVNQIVTILVVEGIKRNTTQLAASIDRLCAFLAREKE